MSLSCAAPTAVLHITSGDLPAWQGRGGVRNWLTSAQHPGAGAERVMARAIAALMEAVDAKDPYTRAHSSRVSRYAAAMAAELGIPASEQREIALAAELHDVGKIGVPDELLRKAGPLSEVERRRLLEHAVIGERILAPLLTEQPAVLAVVRWHHERFDGTGYPDGLRGDQVPLAARIVAVADAFDAMTSARPYRLALPVTHALTELKLGAGSQFDARCVRTLLVVVRGVTQVRRGRPGARGTGSRPRRVRNLAKARGVRELGGYPWQGPPRLSRPPPGFVRRAGCGSSRAATTSTCSW